MFAYDDAVVERYPTSTQAPRYTSSPTPLVAAEQPPHNIGVASQAGISRISLDISHFTLLYCIY